MRLVHTDIANSGEVHRAFVEFQQDTKGPIPEPDIWLYQYADPRFLCLLCKHGKRVVGMVWGKVHPYYAEKQFEVEGFFVRRGFRGKMKFVRGLARDTTAFLKKGGVNQVSYTRKKALLRTRGV